MQDGAIQNAWDKSHQLDMFGILTQKPTGGDAFVIVNEWPQLRQSSRPERKRSMTVQADAQPFELYS